MGGIKIGTVPDVLYVLLGIFKIHKVFKNTVQANFPYGKTAKYVLPT